MTHPLAAYGCLICASPAVELTVTIERGGVLGHYPSCRTHVVGVCNRALTDLDRARRASISADMAELDRAQRDEKA